MSYWDILTEDLQEYIINIRDEEFAKNFFKKGDYYYKDCTFGRIDVSITDISPKTMKIFWNLNFTYRQKYTNIFKHSYTEQKRIKIRYDDDNVPYILFEYNSKCRDKLYFKQLRELKSNERSYCWKFLNDDNM